SSRFNPTPESCGGSLGEGPDLVFHYRVEQPSARVSASLTTTGNSFPGALLYLRKNNCGTPTAQTSCDGPAGAANPGASGPVAGDTNSDAGAFRLQLDVALAASATCDPQGTWRHCGSGLKCQNNHCVATQCADGMDNDGDGKIDYPHDPGCTSPDDDSENTDT